ncbi:hypothetical protein [Microvirga arsenatis]|uniref:Lipoprotein n=1 Tax=Microvirga arsenatis TaxID=2692265 RepID=A0ABW9Z3P4_9HYPH|nr:hypothetical protein [Microvirga arsenatis]NBJ13693.1 hypothetical protein [Microvirga arsenatis]NBJ27157.1 hypothetical protein [Microvirga arsenatis]
MRLQILTSAAALTALTGCVSTADTKPEHFPTTAATRAAIVQYVRENFKDPYSIRDAEISNSWRTAVSQQQLGQNALAVCVRMNAKNSFGGYTGRKANGFILVNGKVAGAEEDSAACNNPQRATGWSPFPELMAIR